MKNKILAYTQSAFIVTSVLVLITSAAKLFSFLHFPITTIVLLYILGVYLIACFDNNYIVTTLASFLATFTFNFFFTEPLYTFNVYDPSYFITFFIMTVISISTTSILIQSRKNALDIRKKIKETEVFNELVISLSNSFDEFEIAKSVANKIYELFEANVDIYLFDIDGNYMEEYVSVRDGKIEMLSFYENVFQQRLHQEDTKAYPLKIKQREFGFIFLYQTLYEKHEQRLMNVIIENAILALDRSHGLKAQLKLSEESSNERFRNHLLKSISHDLRTPLSAMIGSSEMLMDTLKENDEGYQLAKSMKEDAIWLHTMVENILSLTKIQDGKLFIHHDYELMEDVIGSAVTHISHLYPEFQIDVKIPEEAIVVKMDAKLMEQVLINLLDNAVKHSREEKRIEIILSKEDDNVCVEVKDYGEGISENELPHIFETFYTTRKKGKDANKGIGIGLSICESIIRAHGGSISAKSQSTKGAIFSFTLPLKKEEKHE